MDEKIPGNIWKGSLLLQCILIQKQRGQKLGNAKAPNSLAEIFIGSMFSPK